MSRMLFGGLLVVVGLLYLYLAFQAVWPNMQKGDWVAYLGAVLFLAAAAGSAVASVSLVKTKRR